MKSLVDSKSFHIPLAWRRARDLLFLMDAERVHEVSMSALGFWSNLLSSQKPVEKAPYRSILGIDFPNPLGVAAGLDKNAVAIPALAKLGFGHVEVGTITAKPQPGNPRPRLFRVPEVKGIVNRMGFNNQGAMTIAQRIEEFRKAGKIHVPLGINIGKSKVTPLEDAAKDYQESFEYLADLSDYVAINVSSPNTPGLRELQSGENLKKILDAIQSANQKRDQARPILVKFSPDLEEEELLSSLHLAEEFGVKGAILTNTTTDHQSLPEKRKGLDGGLSGQPLFEHSTAILQKVRDEFPKDFVLIGVGGIMDSDTAQAKLQAGADLLQVYTGFIYGGPTFPRNICTGLRALET